jgi:hypothetical protein
VKSIVDLTTGKSPRLRAQLRGNTGSQVLPGRYASCANILLTAFNAKLEVIQDKLLPSANVCCHTLSDGTISITYLHRCIVTSTWSFTCLLLPRTSSLVTTAVALPPACSCQSPTIKPFFLLVLFLFFFITPPTTSSDPFLGNQPKHTLHPLLQSNTPHQTNNSTTSVNMSDATRKDLHDSTFHHAPQPLQASTDNPHRGR